MKTLRSLRSIASLRSLGLLSIVTALALACVATVLAPPAAEASAIRVTLELEPIAGDSVRFVARFTVPAQAAIDSVAARWSIPFNATAQFRRWNPSSLPATITDTAYAAAPPQPGGGNGFGDYRVTVWRGGQSAIVTKPLGLTVPDLSPPLGVTGLVFLDSALVSN